MKKKKLKLKIKPRNARSFERYHPPPGLAPDPDRELESLLKLPAGPSAAKSDLAKLLFPLGLRIEELLDGASPSVEMPMRTEFPRDYPLAQVTDNFLKGLPEALKIPGDLVLGLRPPSLSVSERARELLRMATPLPETSGRGGLEEPVPFSARPITEGVKAILEKHTDRCSLGPVGRFLRGTRIGDVNYSRQVPTAAGGPMVGPGHPAYGLKKIAQSPYLYGEPEDLIGGSVENLIGKTELQFAKVLGDIKEIFKGTIFTLGMFREIGVTPAERFMESSEAFDKKAKKLGKKIKLK